MPVKPLIYTIGHSTRPAVEFLAMLQFFKVQTLVDVRTIPKSRFNPQFNQDTLNASLHGVGIRYVYMPGLGGLRRAAKDSVNEGWRNASFRGYADYMQTPEFDQNLGALMRLARQGVTAIMCAEAVPWRCHRSLIADALLQHGFEVQDIMAVGKASVHKINPMARIQQGRVYYPSSN